MKREARVRGGLLTAAIVGLLLALLLAGCGTARYYAQAIGGGADLLVRRQPIERLLASDRLTPESAAVLATLLEAREFASAELALPDNRSYRSYVELDRPFVSWNVVAAPPLSLEPQLWCFPIAGCVSYRGYFSLPRAERFADRLRERGLDVAVGGVLAYSTLGWFADPVLSTFLALPEEEQVALVIHELAHQVVWVPGDTTFNESFATAVEIEGTTRWLRERERPDLLERYRRTQAEEERFVELVSDYRQRLEALYTSDRSEREKLESKTRIFEEMRRRYLEGAPADARYRAWFERELNNAHLVQIGAYFDLVPTFRELLAEVDRDWPEFYRRVEEMAAARTSSP